MLSVKSDFYRTHGWGRRLYNVSTSSRRYVWRRHLGFKMAAPEMTSTKTWGGLFDPYCGGGGKWRPFRFRPPSWMTSFAEPEMRSSKMAAGSGRAAIFPPPPQWGSKRPPYTTPVVCRAPYHISYDILSLYLLGSMHIWPLKHNA